MSFWYMVLVQSNSKDKKILKTLVLLEHALLYLVYFQVLLPPFLFQLDLFSRE